MKNNLRQSIIQWLPYVFIITILSGTIYVASQQILRQSANDPQIAIAEDVKSRLEIGGSPEAYGTPTPVAIESSLLPYVVIFDDSGSAISYSGILNGKPPTLPAGVFTHAREHENTVTWQPESGVRQAIVVIHYDGPKPGFVMAGRSLQETETRENQLTLLVGVGWLIGMLGSLKIIFLTRYLCEKKAS